jgi:hypothetical protein
MTTGTESQGAVGFVQGLNFWQAFLLHGFLAVVGSIVIGFLPELAFSHAYQSTFLEPYSPAICMVAFVLGGVLNMRVGQSAARWVWVGGTAWLALAFAEFGATQEFLNNFFGTSDKCGSSECLYELIFTTPFAASLAYSLGATFGYFDYRRNRGHS